MYGRKLLGVSVSTLVLCGALSALGVSPARAADPVKITLGYQSLWAGGGQVYEVLRHTNILELNGIKADFKTFTFGGPLGEAALAGEIDNMFAADAPVLRAAARLQGSKILFRTHDARFGVLVRPDFKGTSLSDLKGMKLSGAFGTTAFPRTIRAIVEAGIKDPFSEMTIINQDVAEQALAMQNKLVDAAISWDPTMQGLLNQKAARILWQAREGELLGMQALTGRWLKAHTERDVINLIKAWIMATWWTSNNVDLVHKWFAATSRLPADVLKVSIDYDRNMSRPVDDIKKIDLSISEEDIQGTQAVMDFLYERKLLSNKMDVKPYFDMGPLKKAQEEIAQGRYPDLKAIRIVSP